MTNVIKKESYPNERRCIVCKRTLHKAIIEQQNQQTECSADDCNFKTEIKQALLELKLKQPEINCWNIERKEIFDNESTIISWEVSCAKKVTISEFGDVPLKGNKVIFPQQNTNYTLTIQSYKDDIYIAEKIISVKVFPAPKINNFDAVAKRTKIEKGNSTVLEWNVNNFSKVLLNDGKNNIDVSKKNKYTVKPFQNTKYALILVALDNKTKIAESVNIEVFPKPKIKLFEIKPEVIANTLSSELSWHVLNAKRIEIEGIGEVAGSGKFKVNPSKNTSYKLTAIGELSNETKGVSVSVLSMPSIKSLLLPMPSFDNCPNVNLSVGAPEINLNLNIPEIDINLPDLNFNLPKFIEYSDNIKLLNTRNKPKISIFNFSKIYHYIKIKSKFFKGLL